MARLRPIIRLSTPLSSAQVVERVAESLRKTETHLKGLTTENRIELYVPTKHVHFWSPQLAVDLLDSNGGSDLVCRFGPHPSVWTMYMAGYATNAFICLLSISFSYAQWVMEEPPWALIGLPLALFLAGILYALAFVGQHRGEAQMHEMEDFLRAEIVECEAVSLPPAHLAS